MTKRKKTVLLVVGGLAVLAVVALVGLYLSLNRIIKGAVETVGPKVTGTSLALAAVEVSPFSGKGELRGLVVGNPAGYQTEAAFKLGAITVSLEPRSLTGDTIVLHEVIIKDPEITYELGMGESNLGQILKNVESFAAQLPGAGGQPQPAASGPGKRVQIGHVLIEGAKVRVSAKVLAGKALTLPAPRIELRDIGAGGGVTIGAAIKEVLTAVLKAVTQVVEQSGALGQALKESGKAFANDVKDTGKGLVDGVKGLLKGK